MCGVLHQERELVGLELGEDSRPMGARGNLVLRFLPFPGLRWYVDSLVAPKTRIKSLSIQLVRRLRLFIEQGSCQLFLAHKPQ